MICFVRVFFLTNGAIGRFAEWTIKHIMACLEIHKWLRERNVDYHDYTRFLTEDETAFSFMECYTLLGDDKNKVFDHERFSKDFGKNKLYFLINKIDEPVVRHILNEQYENVFGREEMTKQSLRDKLIQQLKELED